MSLSLSCQCHCHLLFPALGLGPLPTHRRVEGLHGQRWVYITCVGVNVGLLSPGIRPRVLDSRLDIHHLDWQVVELLLRWHSVAVQAVLAYYVGVQVW